MSKFSSGLNTSIYNRKISGDISCKVKRRFEERKREKRNSKIPRFDSVEYVVRS